MPKKKGDIEIGYRMVEELHQLYDTQASSARQLGVHRHCFNSWNAGVTPDCHVLQKLHYCGGDVMYVLTGRRSFRDG